MLESSLSQLETLVGELVEQNRQLLASNSQLTADLRSSQDENETLQLNLLEQEEKHGSTAARIQALVERASAVNA
jgi:regulator of replication initiation timing